MEVAPRTKNEDDLKNEDDIKNEDDLKNKIALKNEDNTQYTNICSLFLQIRPDLAGFVGNILNCVVN